MDQGRGQERKRHAVQHHAGCLGELRCLAMAAQTLSRIRDPSPAYALCRARRFVAIREIDKCEPIRQQLCKVFTDPKSELTGRGPGQRRGD